MTRTFLIAINLPDDGSVTLQETIEDIEYALDPVLEVESVKVWSGQAPEPPPTL